MNLHFITSISKEYWDLTAKYCIPTWNLPGRVTVYVEQTEGDMKWVSEIPFNVELITVPRLKWEAGNHRRKVLKFWGKSYTQIHAVQTRGIDERVIWLDADIEQTFEDVAPAYNFESDFKEAVGLLNSGDHEDCWESGFVIFNQQCGKLGRFIKQYHDAWNNEEIMESLWRPYDAQVIGHVAEKGFYNLCDSRCSNANAVKNSRFDNYFVHWINKENKDRLRELNSNTNITALEELTEPESDVTTTLEELKEPESNVTTLEELKELDNDHSNNISSDSPEPEESRET